MSDYDPDNDPELYDDREEYCVHEDADLDWEGTFSCPCGYRWDATVEQMNEYWRHYELAHRPPTFLERVQERLYWLKQRVIITFRSRQSKELDSDIPF